MKRKLFLYSFLPAFGIASVFGANIASAHGFFGGFGGTLSPDELAVRGQTMFQNQAGIVGISVDELKSAWAEGKTIPEIIKEKNLNTSQIQARMKEARLAEIKSQLQTLVSKGIITQAQADRRLQTMQSMVGKAKGRMGNMHGGFGF